MHVVGAVAAGLGAIVSLPGPPLGPARRFVRDRVWQVLVVHEIPH